MLIKHIINLNRKGWKNIYHANINWNLPHEWQVPNTRVILGCFPRYISRKLIRSGAARTLTASHMKCQHGRWQFNLIYSNSRYLSHFSSLFSIYYISGLWDFIDPNLSSCNSLSFMNRGRIGQFHTLSSFGFCAMSVICYTSKYIIHSTMCVYHLYFYTVSYLFKEI